MTPTSNLQIRDTSLAEASPFTYFAMSVLLETSLGDIVIDLETELCPRTCENFLKLCKVYYYNLNAFFNGEFI